MSSYGDDFDSFDLDAEIVTTEPSTPKSGNMGFLDGILAVAGIGGGRDTYTSTVSGSTTILAIALTVILGLLIYAGFGGFSVRKSR